jgi:signal transduction histidine kinase
MQPSAHPNTNSQLTVELETYLGQLLFDHLRLAQEKDAVIAQAVHDLRGPLTNLKMYIYLLEHAEAEQRAEYMAVLKESVDRLAHLTDGLLEQVQQPDDVPSDTEAPLH